MHLGIYGTTLQREFGVAQPQRFYWLQKEHRLKRWRWRVLKKL